MLTTADLQKPKNVYKNVFLPLKLRHKYAKIRLFSKEKDKELNSCFYNFLLFAMDQSEHPQGHFHFRQFLGMYLFPVWEWFNLRSSQFVRRNVVFFMIF